MKKGIVKEYDRTKGFGFITGLDNEDYFVHISGLREHLKRNGLRAGQKVSFEVAENKGKTSAANIKIVE